MIEMTERSRNDIAEDNWTERGDEILPLGFFIFVMG